MTIRVINDAGELTCVAKLDEGERRVTSLRLDDDVADRTMTGLSVLSGCVAAVLEDVTRNKMTLRQAADVYVSGCDEDSSRRLLQGAGAPAMRALRPEAPTCEGGCE